VAVFSQHQLKSVVLRILFIFELRPTTSFASKPTQSPALSPARLGPEKHQKPQQIASFPAPVDFRAPPLVEGTTPFPS
jgi:hypothetical protein